MTSAPDKKAIAEETARIYLDTGAMYRCVALAGVRAHRAPRQGARGGAEHLPQGPLRRNLLRRSNHHQVALSP